MNDQSVVKFQKPRLPWHEAIEDRFKDMGVNQTSWKALVESCYPGAGSVDSVIMVLSYCQARKLDPFKRPVHIVPIWDSKQRRLVDTVWQGISELRTTAMRTKDYAGTDPMIFGPDVTRTFKGNVKRKGSNVEVEETVTYPQFAQVTIYRMIHGNKIPFNPPPVYWEEAYACEGQSEVPNSMWRKRSRGQLAKCCEAAALRFAFPEEVGNEYAAEEMEGQQFFGADNAKDVTPKPTAEASLDHFSGSPNQTDEVPEAEPNFPPDEIPEDPYEAVLLDLQAELDEADAPEIIRAVSTRMGSYLGTWPEAEQQRAQKLIDGAYERTGGQAV
jgi:phage recombination protein Bet